MLDEARSAGDLYGLVPLVGHPARVPIETATEDDLLASMRANFIGPVLLARDFSLAAQVRQPAATGYSCVRIPFDYFNEGWK